MRGAAKMKIVQPSFPRGEKRHPSPTQANQTGKAMYMTTALAVQLLPDNDDEERRQGKMGFLEHLDELRKRIIRSCVAIGAGMLMAFFFIDRLVTFVLAPARRMLPVGTKLIYTNPSEA